MTNGFRGRDYFTVQEVKNEKLISFCFGAMWASFGICAGIFVTAWVLNYW